MVRVAKLSDCFELASLFEEAAKSPSFAVGDELPSGPKLPQAITRLGSTYPFLVLEEGASLRGFARVLPLSLGPSFKWSVLDQVFLRGATGGEDSGPGLLTALVQLLRKLGYFRVFAAIPLRDRQAIALHEGLGYSALCSLRGAAYGLGAWQDIAWLSFELRESSSSAPGPGPLEPLGFEKFAELNPNLLDSILQESGG